MQNFALIFSQNEKIRRVFFVLFDFLSFLISSVSQHFLRHNIYHTLCKTPTHAYTLIIRTTYNNNNT